MLWNGVTGSKQTKSKVADGKSARASLQDKRRSPTCVDDCNRSDSPASGGQEGSKARGFVKLPQNSQKKVNLCLLM